jgi:hypothetical protein
MDLQNLMRVWQEMDDGYSFVPAATEAEIEQTEAALGLEIPAVLQQLHLFSNGLYVVEGNLTVYPLRDREGFIGLETVRSLVEWGDAPPRPQEILVFGDNGSDEQFGIWLPTVHRAGFDDPIIVIGEFDFDMLAIAGTSLVPFLYGWTAYYALMYEVDARILDALGLPAALRVPERYLDEEAFARIRQHYDPGLPDYDPDPYRERSTVAKLKAFFEG